MTKKVILISVIAIFLVAVITFILINGKDSTNEPSPIVDNETPSAVDTHNEENNVRFALEKNESLKDATIEVTGTSPISKDNVVMTYEGEVADNSVAPGSELAPKVSPALDKKDLPKNAVSLDVSSEGFSPSEFRASAGEPVVLSLTSTDDKVHVIMFDDAAMNAVVIGVLPGQTRAMTFTAPEAGTYTFRCDVPGHKDGGEIGTLIVD